MHVYTRPMGRLALLSLLLVYAAPAAADPPKTLVDRGYTLMTGVGDNAILPDLVITSSGVDRNFKDWTTLGGPDIGDDLKHVLANAADGKSAWIAIDLGGPMMCGMGNCDKQWKAARAKAFKHATMLFDGARPMLVHFVDTVADAEVAKHLDAKPPEVPAGIAKDAEPVVAQLRGVLADPKAFAATVSDRADVVLYGSDPGERAVGGAAVRATWLKWGLALTARGGISAGVTASKTVAWVVLGVDARAKTDKRATPYTMSAIYEKQGSAWKLVQAHFSFTE
jgi:hypothetical protein